MAGGLARRAAPGRRPSLPCRARTET